MRTRFIVSIAVLGAVACEASTPPAPPTPPKPVASSPAPQVTKPATPPEPKNEDFLWLEDVNGEKALDFARAHDKVSEGELTNAPGFRALEQRLFAIYSSKERIPSPRIANDVVRNFWTDAEHPRGLWRQTTLAEFKKKEPAWTILLDIDALGKTEKESWVYHGSYCLHPLRTKCLLRLSKGGGDADVVREFDVTKKAFVPNGFTVPEAKSRVFWKDENTLFVATDFGPGTTTKSGYPRLVKEWKRGTPLSEAKQIFEVKDTDVSGSCQRDHDHGRVRDFCVRSIDFEHYDMFMMVDGKLVKIEKPDDADAETWDDELFIRLRTEWTTGTPPVTYKKGALLAAKLDAFMKGERKLQLLFDPTPRSSLQEFMGTKSTLLVNALTDVKNELSVLSRKPGDKSTSRWTSTPVKETVGSIGTSAFDPDKSDDVWLWLEDFTVPTSLVAWNPVDKKREQVKQNPSFFDAKDVEVTQHFATSRDGTKVPYFEIGKKARSGPAPTVLDAYGGFEISLSPGYAASAGAAWIEKGGVFVQANLRGGGEYGPQWHEAAMKEKRQNAYDDMIAVAEDLVKRGVTTTKKLGIMGGSNGGLLTSVMLTQRPELFGAVVSKVPLTDMQRFHKLLAGASWMSEYGNPDDPKDWAYLSKFSPLHNVKAGQPYPPMLYTTSTKDDRVHPGHARKMVAKLEALGYKPLYYENIEGGHGGAADIKQRAYVDALVYTFLALRLGL